MSYKNKKSNTFGVIGMLLVVLLFLLGIAGIYVFHVGTNGNTNDFEYMLINCNDSVVLSDQKNIGIVDKIEIKVSRPFSFITDEENVFDYRIETNSIVEYESSDGWLLPFEGDITEYFDIQKTESGIIFNVVDVKTLIKKANDGKIIQVEDVSSVYRLILSGGNQTVEIVFGCQMPEEVKPSISLDIDNIIF